MTNNKADITAHVHVIPAEFWQRISVEDFRDIIARGGLNREQCLLFGKIKKIPRDQIPEFIPVKMFGSP